MYITSLINVDNQCIHAHIYLDKHVYRQFLISCGYKYIEVATYMVHKTLRWRWPSAPGSQSPSNEIGLAVSKTNGRNQMVNHGWLVVNNGQQLFCFFLCADVDALQKSFSKKAHAYSVNSRVILCQRYIDVFFKM